MCLHVLCSHDGGEQTLTWRPMLALLQALQDEKVCTHVLTPKGELLVKGVKVDNSQRIHKPRGESDGIMLNSIAFLRRMLGDEGFPVTFWQ